LKGLSQMLKSRRIATQIAILVVTALLIAQAVTLGIFLLFHPGSGPGPSPGVAVAQLAATAKLLMAADNAQARDAILAAARRGLPELHTTSAPEPADRASSDDRLIRHVQRDIGHEFEVFTVRAEGAPPDGAPQIGLRLPDGTALTTAFPAPRRGLGPGPGPGLISALVFLASAIALLSLWAARTLTAPLTQFADAAEQFTLGRSDAPLSEQGPLEIRRAAKALNEMRARIRAMVEDRTRMLAAVGHDLRTPITRLRLRAEEIEPEPFKRQIIGDLDAMRDMVHSALAFLRDEAKSSQRVRTDLPSLMQTLCDGFCDMGRNVSFVGPAHLQATCDPEQLTRALANLIDNGVKFGKAVTVELKGSSDGGPITIEVKDDGPGIAASERERVMEPFYRGDASRGLDDAASFGLGLSIARSVAEAHGGKLELCDGSPRGLLARLTIADADGQAQ
jgi:signal transduction histidine kinase